MKHVLMIVFLISGFAMTESYGQAACNPANSKPADCKPCPPGCCITSCKPGAAAASTSASVSAVPAEVTFASWVAEGAMTNCDSSKMTGKERKACQVACKSAQASFTPASSTGQPACNEKKGVSERNVFQANAVIRQ